MIIIIRRRRRRLKKKNKKNIFIQDNCISFRKTAINVGPAVKN